MENVKAVKSQVTMIVRGMYSNPPNHGARTVSTILNNDELKQEWLVRIKITTIIRPFTENFLVVNMPSIIFNPACLFSYSDCWCMVYTHMPSNP